ncbi:MAG: phosphohistidine phosphatase SixA [Desulfobacterales bacterium]|nr:phosphohistidine phosphatase SixA [Desulfobacterales bacterium]
MNIYIVQHGLSEKDGSGKKVLTIEGIEKVELIAGVAAGYGVKIDKIIHSGKIRAKQTAELISKKFNNVNIVEENDLNPNDDVELFKSKIEANLMIVGHLPYLNRLVSYLVTGNIDKKIFDLQNGGILCLNKDEDGWVIKWGFMPNIS